MEIGQVITLFGIAVPSLLSILTLAYEIRKNRKESYNKRITEERIRWLEKVRDDC